MAFCQDEPPHRLTEVAEVVQTNMILKVVDSASPPPADTQFLGLVEIADSDSDDRTTMDTAADTTGDFDGLFEVFSTEWRCKTPTSTVVSMLPASSTPQYTYHSDAEDLALITELATLLWEGCLSVATPAQVLAASPALRKNFVEKLQTKRTETSAAATTSHEIYELTTPRQAAFSLPLQEVEVVINDNSTEHAILDQGSQIMVICADVAHVCGAQINTQHRIQMEGTNSVHTWTLGCAENLPFQLGDLSFVFACSCLGGRTLLPAPWPALLQPAFTCSCYDSLKRNRLLYLLLLLQKF